MLWNFLFKRPIFTLGLLMFGLFIYQVGTKEKWWGSDRFESTSCKGVLVRLEKLTPGNWKVFCEGNNLAVVINEMAIPEESKNLRMLMYRQLANHMSFIAKNATSDILEKVMFVRFRLTHPKLQIDAVTEGQYIVKLATIEKTEHIMTHLKTTVQVKETVK